MAWLIILCLVNTLIPTQADTFPNRKTVACKDNQHCSKCDGMGNCIECTPGYFGKRCNASCSDKCLNRECTESAHGSINCTDGCVLGYLGTSCNIPCDSPGGSCTACPGGCDEGYCQLGSSCVFGCVDSYYGTDCKSCSKLCKTCNRSTGGCIECENSPESEENCEAGDSKNNQQGNGDTKRSVLTGVLVSLLPIMTGILVTLCLMYYKRLPKQREQTEQREQMHQDEVEYLDYLPSVQGDVLNTNRHSNHAYYDVVDDGEMRPTIVFL